MSIADASCTCPPFNLGERPPIAKSCTVHGLVDERVRYADREERGVGTVTAIEETKLGPLFIIRSDDGTEVHMWDYEIEPESGTTGSTFPNTEVC